MNKEQEEIGLKIIRRLKENNVIIYARHLNEIEGVTTIILKLLEDLNLIKLHGGGTVRLKDKGFEF